MINLQQIAMSIIQNNPKIANNPRAQEMINVINSGDSIKGEELARNLCSSYGMSVNDATKQAQRFFHLS